MTNEKREEHSFSVEMKSELSIKKISFNSKERRQVFFEGFLGKLQSVVMVEGLMLQIEGANGILRVDIAHEDLGRCLEAAASKSQGGEQE